MRKALTPLGAVGTKATTIDAIFSNYVININIHKCEEQKKREFIYNFSTR